MEPGAYSHKRISHSNKNQSGGDKGMGEVMISKCDVIVDGVILM